MRSVSIFGCGYTGTRLAQRAAHGGHPVRGYGSRVGSIDKITAAGATAEVLDLDGALGPIDLDGEDVYYLVPPASSGQRDLRLERWLSHIVGRPHCLVYMSTTGVYGDRQGAVVDEDTPPAPRTERAQRRLAAETATRAWAQAQQIPWRILRVPGIYGPGRLPLERLRNREPAIVAGEAGPGNRIHVDDLVSACLAATTASSSAGRIFNVTDGSDDSLTAYLERVARIVDLPPPPAVSRAEAERTFSRSSWSFLGESRRVDNRRMLSELGVELAYRDLDAGIRASL